MSIQCSVYIATSIDGFIAKPDGDIEWLHRPEYGAADLNGLRYDEFIATVDTLVMGRHTFEKVLSFGHWPYEGTPVIVLTRREIAIPDHLRAKVKVASGTPEALVATWEAEGHQHLYIDGGKTIQGFLQAGLIHEITMTYLPILLGGGISLFGLLGIEVPLRLIVATTSPQGLFQVRYAVEFSV